jgi:hypothetical protein
LAIGTQRLLMKTSKGLVLLKFNYKSGEVISISDVIYNPIPFSKLILDQSNENNFLTYNSTSFAIGNLANDNIVFGPFQQFNSRDFAFRMLIDNQMRGFRSVTRNDAGDRFVEYFKVDLSTLAEEMIEVPFVLNDGRVIYDFEVDFLLLF